MPENECYTNPVLFCDYSDPDVLMHDGKFYMTASSFNYIPGLPILESDDLVNWRLVNYAAKTIPFDRYDKPLYAKGIWAPSLRFHNGRYIITVALPDEGIFVTETADPRGIWPPLRCVWEGKGFIDPCPLWDTDGTAWIVHAYAKSRTGINSMLGLLQADPETLVCMAEPFARPGEDGDCFIFDGRKTQPTIEGPKLYYRNGWYYILAPAGGVPNGWQTVLRSKTLTGPYEARIVLNQGTSPVNGPHQGGLVTVPDGSDWFLHFQARGAYGRIVHLQPVSWKDNWPCMGTGAVSGKIPGEPVLTFRKPCLPDTEQTPYRWGPLDWQWPANPRPEFIASRPAAVNEDSEKTFPAGAVLSVLSPDDCSGEPVLWNCPNILTKKISDASVSVTAILDISGLSCGGRSGLILIGNQYAAIEVYRTPSGFVFRYVESEADQKNGPDSRQEHCISESPVFTSVSSVTLTAGFRNTGAGTAACAFSAAAVCSGADPFCWTPKTVPFIPESGTWAGCRFGCYAVGRNGGQITVTGYREEPL